MYFRMPYFWSNPRLLGCASLLCVSNDSDSLHVCRVSSSMGFEFYCLFSILYLVVFIPLVLFHRASICTIWSYVQCDLRSTIYDHTTLGPSRLTLTQMTEARVVSTLIAGCNWNAAGCLVSILVRLVLQNSSKVLPHVVAAVVAH